MQHSYKPPLSQRLARHLVGLYPAGWRERYAEEMLLILEDNPPTWKTLLNLFIHLFDAYLLLCFMGGGVAYYRPRTSNDNSANDLLHFIPAHKCDALRAGCPAAIHPAWRAAHPAGSLLASDKGAPVSCSGSVPAGSCKSFVYDRSDGCGTDCF